MSETGKQRRSRIELGYYRKPDAMSRRRGRLTLLVLLVAGVWVIAAPTWDGRRSGGIRFFEQDRLASKGPLARPHAMWESTCAACHKDFAPINGSRWSPSFIHDANVGNGGCQNCHSGAVHHASQRNPEVSSCAECHRDHRGSEASLLAMDDSVCTSCHRDLAQHRDGSAVAKVEAVAVQVTQFDAKPDHHPPFTPPKDVSAPDSARIKFSHARHMAPGLTTQEGGSPFTFACLDEPDRGRYGFTSGREKVPIQLSCETCHRLDGAEDGQAMARIAGAPVVARASGALMLPVTYENDCRACHQLRFEPKDPKRPVRHGSRPGELVQELLRYYTAEAVKKDPVLLERFIPPRAMPHQPVTGASERAEKAAADRTLVALKLLFGAAIDEKIRIDACLPLSRRGCVECHELTPTSPALVDLEAAERLEMKDVKVQAPWYEHARFDHAAHRGLECTACHSGVAEAKDQHKLLLPDVGKCVPCHAPATSASDGQPRGGAGVSCVECHRYHNGDHPAQGIGARARRGKAAMPLNQFRRGGPPGGR